MKLIPIREGGDELLVFGPGDDWRRYALHLAWQCDIITHFYRHLQQLAGVILHLCSTNAAQPGLHYMFTKTYSMQVQQDEIGGSTRLINRKQTNKAHTEIMKTKESKSQKTGKTEQSK